MPQNAALAYLLLVTSPYEALVYPIFTAHRCIDLLCNITFSGGGYDISVLLSDEDCKVVGLNVSGDNGSIISIETKDLAAFSKAESDCKKKTIHLVAPATKSHPYSN